ncbi:PspC domain-containing protein [Candidatus Bipolaricaulota bacterium]|nr:PspC domain-containing protein [Candidatus Bipolaricaulota bacterium]
MSSHATLQEALLSTRQLHRSRTDRRLAGVCGGLAEYFDMDPLLVRILFFVFVLCGTAGFWAYLLLWLLVPEE